MTRHRRLVHGFAFTVDRRTSSGLVQRGIIPRQTSLRSKPQRTSVTPCSSQMEPTRSTPRGCWTITRLEFESLQAKILSWDTSNTHAIIKARGSSSTRNFYIEIRSGTLQGPTAGSGVNGIDFLSTSYGRVQATFISQCGDGIQIGGSRWRRIKTL
jgi:hypothetical protein